MWPLSQGELARQPETALDVLIDDPAGLVSGAPSAVTRADYERIVLAGGFPLALAREPGRSRDRWFRDFIALVVERDVLEIRKIRQRQVLPHVLRRLAGQTGQVVSVANIADSVWRTSSEGLDPLDGLSASEQKGTSSESSPGDVSPQTPTGARGKSLQIAFPDGASTRNLPGAVDGIDYSGHAFDRMQQQGIMPSAVQSALSGDPIVGKVPGTTAFYDPLNDLTVITNADGKVITVDYGQIKQ
jgi:hypothetical protein